MSRVLMLKAKTKLQQVFHIKRALEILFLNFLTNSDLGMMQAKVVAKA